MNPRIVTRPNAAASALLLGGCAAAVAPAPPPPAPTAVATVAAPMLPSAETDTPYITRNLTLTLLPSGGGPASAEKGPAAWEVWKDLLRGMPADPETPRVLKTILGNWPATLTVLDLADTTDEALRAAPAAGDAFALRIAGQGTDRRGPNDRDGLNGLLLFGMAVRIDGPLPHGGSGTRVVAYGRTVLAANVPEPDEAVLLLADDFLLRRHPGWRVYGPEGDPKHDTTDDPEARRADLDRRIDAYAAKIRTYYGVPKGDAPAQ